GLSLDGSWQHAHAPAKAPGAFREAQSRQENQDGQTDDLDHAAEVSGGLSVEGQQLQYIGEPHRRSEDAGVPAEKYALEHTENGAGETHDDGNAEPAEVHVGLGNETGADGDVVQV